MRQVILILFLSPFISCGIKNEQHKICIPYKTELDISFGETASSIKMKFRSLEKAYFNSGDTLVYLDIDRFERNGESIRSSIYFHFYKSRLNKVNSLYELQSDDSVSLNWIREEISKCSALEEKQSENSFWQYNDEKILLRLSVSFDKLIDSTQRCWYLIEQKK